MTATVRTSKNARSRDINLAAEIKKTWGVEWSRPEVAYEFSNKRQFDNNDRSTAGLYGDRS